MNRVPARPVSHRAQKSLVLACLVTAVAASAVAGGAGSGTPTVLAVTRVTYDGAAFPNPCANPALPDFPSIFSCPSVTGITGKVHVDLLATHPSVHLIGTLNLTDLSAGSNVLTTSFSSKSEGALMASPDGRWLTYFGYNAGVGLNGVSNSYTTGAGTNLNGNVAPRYDREVAIIAEDGSVTFTPEANAYSGDNPRAAISPDGVSFYMAGNSDSTTYTSGANVPGPGTTIGARLGMVGSNSSIQLGKYFAADRPEETAKQHVKDNNFRGIGIFFGNLYTSKGSGGNGDDGLFQVHAGAGDGLPTSGTSNAVTQLFGAPATDPATGAASPLTPFGFWFADPSTLYVADEGYANPAANGSLVPDPMAGLQKWSYVGGAWHLDYIVSDGLQLYVPTLPPGYPLYTQTAGLRNLTGHLNGDGTVTLFAMTAQYSVLSGGETDPTRLVAVTDEVANTTAPTKHGRPAESFTTLWTAAAGEVLRGVALAPCGLVDTVAPGAMHGATDPACRISTH